MRATGLFFLRMRAYTARHGVAGDQVVMLPVVERVQNSEGHWITQNTLLAQWAGAEALAFFHQHQRDLSPGRGVELELDRLRGHDGEWRAHVTKLTLAPLPPSWQKASATAGDQPPTTTQAQPA
jgi:hypothetical protein